MYNYLDLPQSVTASGATATYVYDGGGRKLRSTNGIDGQTRDYIDGIEYSGTTLELIHMEEGRILRGGSGTYTYEYLLKDHLGNIRSGFSGAVPGTPTFGSDYYPFGMQIQSNMLAVTPKNNYLYNGKELQDRLRLVDYGARFYDPVIGRFGTIDPLSEQMRRYSPYSYAFDNPIRFVDRDGLAPDDPNDPFLIARIFVTAFYDAKHALYNTVQRAVGSDSRAGYKVVNGSETFETEFYKAAPVNSVGGALAEAGSAVGDALSLLPQGKEGVALFSRSGNSASVTREARDILKANKEAGKAGEDFLNRTFGGETQVGLGVGKDRRVIDNLTEAGVAQESKVGRTSASSRVRSQVAKDVNLRSDKDSPVKSVEWHFFPGQTGSGPTTPLQELLNKHNIPFKVHE